MCITIVTGRNTHAVTHRFRENVTHLAKGVDLIECCLCRCLIWERSIWLAPLGSKVIRRQACETDVVIRDPLHLIILPFLPNSHASPFKLSLVPQLSGTVTQKTLPVHWA
jgi:hypothetical protein